MMMWVRYSRTQMMTRKIMRHKVTYTVKVYGQGGASKCLDVLRASTIELSQRAIRNKLLVYFCLVGEKRRGERR